MRRRPVSRQRRTRRGTQGDRVRAEPASRRSRWRWLSGCQSASWPARTVAGVRLTSYESVYVLRKP